MWFNVVPCDLSFTETARFRLENEVLLPAPPERVFEVLTSAKEWPRWFKDFVGTDWTSPPPHGVGALRDVHLKTMSVKERFLAWDPGRRLCFTVYAQTLPLTSRFMEDFQLEPAPGGSRLRWTVYYEPTRAMRLVHPVARLVFGKMFRDAAKGLAAYLDRSAAPC